MARPLTRGSFSGGLAALAAIAVIPRPAVAAAQFTYKLGHTGALEQPLNQRFVQATDAIRTESGGRLDITVYGHSQLGSDPAMLSQIRTGALEFLAFDATILSSLVPVASIGSLGFAFRDTPQALAAFDGDLGAYVRRECEAKDLYVFNRILDLGFRQITSATHPIRNADDLVNMKIRTAPSKMDVDLFNALGASATPIPFADLYTSLQTKLVDGEEAPYVAIESSHFYEVQKYLAMSNHSWSSFWLVGNNAAWKALPSDLQAIATRNFGKYIDLERRDTAAGIGGLQDKLRAKGMLLNPVDTASMRARLGGYFRSWKAEFGPTVWSLLEKYTGKLS
jgi:tripartite ATP-independent transporter DctP family solute receptor